MGEHRRDGRREVRLAHRREAVVGLPQLALGGIVVACEELDDAGLQRGRGGDDAGADLLEQAAADAVQVAGLLEVPVHRLQVGEQAGDDPDGALVSLGEQEDFLAAP
jgi:hypothetical protein